MLVSLCKILINVISSNATTLNMYYRVSLIVSIGLWMQPVLVSSVIFLKW